MFFSVVIPTFNRRELLRQALMSVWAQTFTDYEVIVVDDGIDTGTTVRAALKALRRRGAARLVLAVPVAPHDTLTELRREVDRIVCLAEPDPFRAIGLHYVDFTQVSDDEVIAALEGYEPSKTA